jgi:hypothetical protein
VEGYAVNTFKITNYNDFRVWLVSTCMAATDKDKVDCMQHDGNGNYPVIFSVGGVELDFDAVAKGIEESLDAMVTEKAVQLLNNKYQGIIDDVMDIQERISEQKHLFKYDWE